MVRTFIALALVSIASPLASQSAFDGTWRLEATATHRADTRFDIELSDGIFTCRWCSPVWSIPADGAFHQVEGQSRFDEASVQIVDGSTAVFNRRKNGRTYYQAVDTVSPDGSTLYFAYMEVDSAGKVETGTGLWSRLASGPDRAHRVSGQWREMWVKATSENDVQFTIVTTGEEFRIALAPGETLTAKINGPAEPVDGDPRGTMASLLKLGETVLVQTDYRGGEAVSVTSFKVLDAATMELVIEDKRTGYISQYRARKQ